MLTRNKDYYSTGEVASLLGISDSTVRRWANEGTLKYYKLPQTKYRRFDKETVDKLCANCKNICENPETRNNIDTKKVDVVAIDKSIEPSPHPAHYLMHKYWGRKPHNVVSYYINNYTNEGDTVLDPFMGSGITVVEAVKSSRKVIGIDLNPIAFFIVKNTLEKVDLNEFTSLYNKISETVKHKYGYLYSTSCPICGEQSYIETMIWENECPVKIRGICNKHRTFIKDIEEEDNDLLTHCSNLRKKLEAEGQLHCPKDEIMKYVKRSGRERIDELFTDRAQIILSDIIASIRCIKNESIQSLMAFCFSSMLSNTSKMLPGDKEKATYKSGWVISKFWTPKINTERNIFSCLNLRYKAIMKGKQELVNLHSELAEIYNRSSEDLSFINSNSIDYIFTDPPYGESIAYLSLSQFWNSWLFQSVDYENEIIIDPYRNKKYDDYDIRIKHAYKELFRVLKPNHYMSFTFNNRDMNVWKSILEACLDCGFILINIVLQEQAVSSGTQGINKKNTLTGDFVYNFMKPGIDAINIAENNTLSSDIDAETYILNEIDRYINVNSFATPTQIYEHTIPIIAKYRLFTASNGTIINIESILKKHYKYIRSNSSENHQLGSEYIWVKK